MRSEDVGLCTRWILPRPATETSKGPPVLVAMGGDGIGPEVVAAGIDVLRATGVALDIRTPLHGPAAVEAGLEAFSADARAECDRADAVLFGAAEKVSVPILRYLRWTRNTYANLRPSTALFPDARSHEIDLVLVRELCEDLYPGREGSLADFHARWPEFRDRIGRPLPPDGRFAMKIATAEATRRVARYGAQLALHRRAHGLGPGRVTVVTKANVLPGTDGFFLQVAREEIASVAPDIVCDDLYADEVARRLVGKPQSFDVIVTTNLFGDILSDVASEMAGAMPEAPSGAIGSGFAYFEPVHGSAPDIAGKDLANPIGTMFSAAMALEYLGYSAEAERIVRAVRGTFERGVRTRDVGGTAGTREFTAAVCAAVER